MPQIIDRETIINLKNGDTHSLSLLYSAYADQIYQLAFKLLKDTGWSEDLVQEVFIKIWNSREFIQEDKSIWPLLHTITKRECLNKLRSIKNSQAAFDKLLQYVQNYSCSADHMLLNKELAAQIDSCFSKLSFQQERAIMMSKVEGLSYNEIAQEMQISPNTVKNHLVQAIKHLKKSPLNKDALQVIWIIYLLIK